jgi:hypothetical protein
MENKPIGLIVIYFNDASKNVYGTLPPDKDLAKRLSKRIYKDAMTALSAERQKQITLLKLLAPKTAIPLDSNIQTC